MLTLASDFDGTLFHSKKAEPFLHEDIAAIKRFQKAGNLFGVCTGRPLQAVLDATLDRITYDFYILSSGAVILDREKHILFQNCLAFPTMETIVELFPSQCVVQADNKVFAFQTKTSMPTRQEILSSPKELKDAAIYGISIFCNSESEAEKVCQTLHRQFPEEVRAFQNLHYVDIIGKGCSKGTGMDFLKHRFPSSCLGGIGDSYNDEPMMRHADVSFTFHHSPKQVQKICDHVVSSVAQAIHIMEELPR